MRNSVTQYKKCKSFIKNQARGRQIAVRKQVHFINGTTCKYANIARERIFSSLN